MLYLFYVKMPIKYFFKEVNEANKLVMFTLILFLLSITADKHEKELQIEFNSKIECFLSHFMQIYGLLLYLIRTWYLLRVSLGIFKTKVRKSENPKIRKSKLFRRSEINVLPAWALYLFKHPRFYFTSFFAQKKNYVFSFQNFSTSHFIRFSALNRWSCQFHSNTPNSVRVIKVYRLLCNLTWIIKKRVQISFSDLKAHTSIIEWSAFLTDFNKNSCRNSRVFMERYFSVVNCKAL